MEKGENGMLIDRMSSVPVYEQIIKQIEKGIESGVYEPGAPLPSVRELSVSSGINPNTVQKAYAYLSGDGLICSSPGNGCYVTEKAPQILTERARRRISELETLVGELKASGISKEEMLAAVEKSFDDSER